MDTPKDPSSGLGTAHEPFHTVKHVQAHCLPERELKTAFGSALAARPSPTIGRYCTNSRQSQTRPPASESQLSHCTLSKPHTCTCLVERRWPETQIPPRGEVRNRRQGHFTLNCRMVIALSSRQEATKSSTKLNYHSRNHKHALLWQKGDGWRPKHEPVVYPSADGDISRLRHKKPPIRHVTVKTTDTRFPGSMTTVGDPFNSPW